jgi:hypothetical protein
VFAHCADCNRTYQGTPVPEPPDSAILTEKTPRRIKREQSVAGHLAGRRSHGIQLLVQPLADLGEARLAPNWQTVA